MKTAISLAKIGAADRQRTLEGAADGTVRHLKERFPESAGFSYKIEERLAKWAWPRGTKMSEKQILASIDPETRKRAFRRGIRITKGLRWGLTMDMQSTDREMSGVQLTVMRESPLSVIVAIAGFIVGILAAVGYGFTLDVYKDDYRNIVIAVFIGLAIGGVLAGIGWLASRPLESLKPEQVQEISDSLIQRMEATIPA